MPKLTLRDLFAVVTIVALALGWWLDRSRLADARDDWQAKYAIMEAAADHVHEQLLGCLRANSAAAARDQPSHSK
jgi:hypothetical protein